MKAWREIKNWYWRHERRISSISLLSGFVVDAVVLKRVDLFIENFWIIVHLLIAGAGIIGLNLYENRRIKIQQESNLYWWLIIVTQFAFGGLFSTFLVFYFRSAALSTSWPFLLILATNLIANEILKHHYSRLSFQLSVFFISIFSFAIFFVPVVVHRIGPIVFLLSGAVSLIAILIFIWLLAKITRERFRQSRRLIWWSLGTIFIGINILYFANLIPPIPLALKDADAYHAITRTVAGNYEVAREARGWRDYFRKYEPVQITAGETLYAYSAVFSPTRLNTNIVHEWQFYDSVRKSWVTNAEIELPIIGGRDNGYRTYSKSSGLSAGWWRVNVKTKTGQLIGRINFLVQIVKVEPKLITNILS